MYCVSKTNQSSWYWATNSNGTYLEVEGIQSVGLCSPYLFDPNAIFARNFFFIDNASFYKIEKACNEDYYSQPAESRHDFWYRFAKGSPKNPNQINIDRPIPNPDQIVIMSGHKLCKNSPYFEYTILKN